MNDLMATVKKAQEERAELVDGLKERLVAIEAEATEIRAALKGLVPRTRTTKKAKEEAEG